MFDPAYEDTMERLLVALTGFLNESSTVQHTHLANFYEVWHREEGVSYNTFLDALEWTAGYALADDFDTLYVGDDD